MPGDLRVSTRIARQEDLVLARQSGRELAQAEGLGTADQTRLATVISELVRNILLYAGSGCCEMFVSRSDGFLTITIRASDSGPGIPDLAKAMTPGFSTSNGLGAGLPGVKRLMDSFAIDSQPGRTQVVVSMKRRHH